MSRPDLDAINADAPPHGRLRHTQHFSFGPSLGLDVYTMDNGLRVLLLEDHSAPVVAYHTWFRVGSRDEREGKTGIAHLFEHLMFNETENLPKGEFDRRLEQVGAETNASTWLDFTQYNIAAPSEQLPLLIEVESDRMQHLVLREPQVESEKEVVANERRYRVDDDVEGTVNELLWSTAFTRHPYRWPTIGWMEDILAFTTEDCEQFYRTYYAPNNASVTLVGDFEPSAALRNISQKYGVIPASALSDRHVPEEPPQTEERRVEITKPTVSEKLSIGYRCPPLSAPEHIALNVVSEVLSGGRASRLYRRLVRQLELAGEVRTFVGPFRDPGLLEVYAAAREERSAEELLTVIDEELERIRREPISQAELDRARARFELGLLQSLDTADGKAQTIGFYDCLLSQPNAAFERLEQLAKLTPADLLSVAHATFDPSARSMVIVRVGPSAETATEDTAA